METLWRIDFNFVDQTHYEFYEVGLNCIAIKEIDQNWCRIVCKPESVTVPITENGMMRHVTHETTDIYEVQNINKKYFKKDLII